MAPAHAVGDTSTAVGLVRTYNRDGSVTDLLTLVNTAPTPISSVSPLGGALGVTAALLDSTVWSEVARPATAGVLCTTTDALATCLTRIESDLPPFESLPIVRLTYRPLKPADKPGQGSHWAAVHGHDNRAELVSQYSTETVTDDVRVRTANRLVTTPQFPLNAGNNHREDHDREHSLSPVDQR
ncbi:hypothetical protein [Streptomyces marianii]|uniref:Uncharacterized protein n=1 Tax=Streptomyces marianii TaxID=1817406 RepID=A0A5R9E0D9_9ACTN|nr:hypothetical protein [Streptomyces marianii]TLQ42442.1 hypothetical protein FEF34_03780 [Streptomyces marianii]